MLGKQLGQQLSLQLLLNSRFRVQSALYWSSKAYLVFGGNYREVYDV
jgi:hypothetical protein